MNKNSVGHMKCQPPSVTATAAAVEVVLNSSNTSEEDVQEVPTPLVEDHLKRRVNDATELKNENAPEKLKEKHLVEVRKERHYHDDGEGNLLFQKSSSLKVETSICVGNYSQNQNDLKIIENDKRIHSDSNSLLDIELKTITTSSSNKKRKLNEDKHKVCLVESCSYFGKPNPLISLDKVDSTNDNSEKNDKINDEINDKNGKGSGMEEDEDAFSKPSASKRIKLDGDDDLLSIQRINDFNKIDEKQVDDVNINNLTVTDDNASSSKHNVKGDIQHPILNSASLCELITDGEVGVISVTGNKKCNKKYESNSDIVQISSSDDEDDEEEDDDEDDDGEDEEEDDDDEGDDDEEIVANDEEDVLCSYSPKTSLLPALALPITSTTSTLMTTKHVHVSGSCHECYMIEMKIVDLKINAIKTGTTQCIFSESCLLLKNSLRNLLGDAAPTVTPIHASCLESSNWTPLYGGSLIHMTLNLTGCHGNMVEFFGISRQLFDRYIAGKFPATTLQLYFEEHSMRPTLQQDFEKFFRSSYYVYNNFGNNAYDVLYPPAEYNNMNNSVSHVNTMYQQQQMSQYNSLINDAFVSRQDVSQQSKETLKHDDPYDKNVTKPQKAQRLKAKSLSLFHFEIHRSDKTAGNKFTFYRPPKWPYLKKVKNFTPISSSSNDKEKIKQVCCDDLNARMSFSERQIHDNGSVKNSKEIWNSHYQHSQNSNQNSNNENSYFSQQQLQQYQHDNHFSLNNYSSSFNNYPTNLLNQANYNFQQMHLNNSNNNNLMYPHLNLAAQNFFQQQQLFGQWQNNVDFKLQQQHHQQQQQHFYHSKSPTYVQSGFTGNIVKLFTYRPANSKGGINITNEDLYCLNDGEYLNDVIIDFYLKFVPALLFNDSFHFITTKILLK
ncbi:hypothetical protein HELRODRAFT_188989 [Helobdella robusta]|uniref:Uncharacterized protein n=1 Tax=Helobdella robusta TaxID=6412 RepID=T1FQJ3_HELRO|nr:hypothetical protein HELRODRAFT_188989 [Helobdella robusta]ESN99065.1 hypothetical protein HELRODRAFT_188989 [Helobdella robusta]